jgi:cytochrome P450
MFMGKIWSGRKALTGDGARGCIGSKFTMAQSLCVIANLIRRYEVLLLPFIEGKPEGVQREWMLRWTTGVTIRPINARVRLRARV